VGRSLTDGLLSVGRAGPGRRAAQPQRDVHQPDEDGHLDERADDAGEGLAAGDAEGADRHRDAELDVVAGGGERHAEVARLSGEGLFTDEEMGTTCCFATQDKVWVTGPGGERWEVYTVLADSDTFGAGPTTLGEDGQVPGGGRAAATPRWDHRGESNPLEDRREHRAPHP
jgi:hypothetical protein